MSTEEIFQMIWEFMRQRNLDGDVANLVGNRRIMQLNLELTSCTHGLAGESTNPLNSLEAQGSIQCPLG